MIQIGFTQSDALRFGILPHHFEELKKANFDPDLCSTLECLHQNKKESSIDCCSCLIEICKKLKKRKLNKDSLEDIYGKTRN